MNREMDIAKFYGKIFEDTDLREKLKSEMKKVKTESELKRLIEEEIIPISQKMGEKFTVNDLINFEKESINKISIEDLENVSGGISLKPVILGGGLLALSLFGIKVNTADAAIPTDVIANYNVHATEGNGQQPIERNQGIEQPNEQQIEENQGIAQPNEQQIEKNQGIAQTNESQQGNGGVSNTSDPIPMTDVLNANVIGENEQQATTDEEYIMTALNPRDAFAMNLSGATENFRFYNGDIKTIAVGEPGGDGIPRLEYNKYSGEGSANVMTSLFPSSAGSLSIEGGYGENHPFSADCAPTPELVASIVAYLHNHVRTAAKDQKFDYPKMVGVSKGFNKFEKLTEDPLKGNPLEKPTNTNGVPYFLRYRLNLDVKTVEKLQKDKKQFQTLMFLLKNAQYMIENQEQDGTDATKDRILPQYTTERMIMCYFLKHFNTKDDLDAFYTAVRKKIHGHGGTKVSDKTKERDESMKAVLSKIKYAVNCPYKSRLGANGDTKKIVKDGENLKFTNYNFQDCAEITARHFLNLMGYNDANKWDYFLARTDESILENNKNQILNAIKSDGELPNLSLKDRLQAFMHYQSKVGADDTSIETRSFWNSVVSHLDKPSADSGLYPIRYNGIYGNEVDTGFVNMLKLTYNLLHALGKDCSEAKNAIDEMINTPNENNLETAMNAILKIFDAKAQVLNLAVKMDSTSNEIYGDLTVDSNGKKFPIHHDTCHAKVDFYPFKTEKLEKDDKEFMNSDPIAQLLVKKFGDRLDHKKENISNFNRYYTNISISNKKEYDFQRYKNYQALKFLKTIEGEGNNIEKVRSGINKHCKDANITILGNKKKNGNKKSISDFIFLNYALKSEAINQFVWGTNNVIDDKLYELCKENNLIGKDNAGNEYICVKNGDAVKVFPFWHGCDCPEDIVIPSEVNYDGQTVKVSGLVEDSFRGNRNIKTIKMSIDGNLSKHEFSDCTNLESVEISGKVDELDITEMFYNCKNLKSIKISANVGTLYIGEEAFNASKKLEEFEASNVTGSVDIENNAFKNCSELKNLKISGTATGLSIGDNAFKGCTLLTNVELPNVNGSISIKESAFEGREKLTSLTISGSANYLYIGESAFEECTSLTEVELPNVNGNVDIRKGAFRNCKELKAFNILGEIKKLTIGYETFKDCEALEEFKVPESVEELKIGKDVFKGCKKLKKIVIPVKFKEKKFLFPDGVNVSYY